MRIGLGAVMLLLTASDVPEPAANPCRVTVEQVMPYFRGCEPRGPSFLVWVRNAGPTPITVAAFENAFTYELDGTRISRPGVLASGFPIAFGPGERGQASVLLGQPFAAPLEPGLHTFAFICGPVRSKPVSFWWHPAK